MKRRISIEIIFMCNQANLNCKKWDATRYLNFKLNKFNDQGDHRIKNKQKTCKNL